MGRFWTLLAIAGLFLVGMVWQTSRFADLKAEARELEAVQKTWITENLKLEAEIARLSSRERTSGLAGKLGLTKALPEDTIRIRLAPASVKGAEASND